MTYEINSDKPFSGISVNYHDNGLLDFRRNYKNGQFHGLAEYYYKNGQLEQKLDWQNGKLHGISERYYENGELHYKMNYNMLFGTVGYPSTFSFMI